MVVLGLDGWYPNKVSRILNRGCRDGLVDTRRLAKDPSLVPSIHIRHSSMFQWICCPLLEFLGTVSTHAYNLHVYTYN